MAELTIEVPDRLVYALARMFPEHANPASKLAALAFSEYAEWLTGESRPTNISELSIRRISEIFAEVLPDQIPDTSILVNEFGIPLGRARFILQAIGYQQTGEIRRRTLRNIREALDAERVRLEAMPEEERGSLEEAPEITIANQAEALFRDIAFELCRDDASAPEPRRSRNLGTHVCYSVRQQDIGRLLNKVDRLIESTQV